VLKKIDNEGFINIGFIDDDKKNVPSYFAEFELIAEITEVLLLKKHTSSKRLLICSKTCY